MKVQFQPLEKFDVLRLAAKVKDQWFSQSLCEANGSVIRMGVVQGTYHWHKHDQSDQFFFCIDGEFQIEMEDRTVTLQSQQGVVIPKGRIHRPRAQEKSLILIAENG